MNSISLFIASFGRWNSSPRNCRSLTSTHAMIASSTNLQGFDRAPLFAASGAPPIVRRTSRHPTRQILKPRSVIKGLSSVGRVVDLIGFRISSASSKSFSCRESAIQVCSCGICDKLFETHRGPRIYLSCPCISVSRGVQQLSPLLVLSERRGL